MNAIARKRAIAAVVLAWAAVAQGGPVELKAIPAGAKWLAHVDLDAARSSPVTQAFLRECGKDWAELRGRVVEMCQKAGLENCKQLHGITAFGTKIKAHEAVLIIHADWNKQALAERAEKSPDHKTIDYGNHQIHTWTAHLGEKYQRLVAGVLYKPDVLLLAWDVQFLKAELDVLDGKAPNLAGSDSPLAAKLREGTIFTARAAGLKPADAEAGDHCAALRLIERVDYEEGQSDGRWFFRLALTTASQPVAEDMKKVAEGFWALLALHVEKESKLVEMFHRIKVAVDGKTVTMTFDEPADELAAQMPALCKFVTERAKMHMTMMEKMHMERTPGSAGMKCPMCSMAPGMAGKKPINPTE